MKEKTKDIKDTNRFFEAKKRLQDIEKKIAPFTDQKRFIDVQMNSEWCDDSCLDL